MLADALYAWLHYVAILMLASALGAEALLLRAQPGAATLKALFRADLIYGVSAAVVLVTGLLRVWLGVKGAGYYGANTVFWIKMALFVVIGLVSVVPTMRILRWRRMLRADPEFRPDPVHVDATRRLVFIELHMLAFVPLAAALMARGYGV